ncbi:MAG: sigma-70 family RNA polymerase sigma factor [Paraglaciecola sp.]|uniref:sigma-70 family RNA polymerase sigma factor n=1 Tax=Paraglaciecola sp. TaxID=1920173 RepID=UPI00273EC605|nr:sigma-70 family RNA polymerase sigma factor [Paraglaciecola sp.]MDP5032322.1 sigma-70 family RNA polymerase sigma factor [Paraglaciecola sp.]MDP5134125.1 sigma-70 family RNA polymerase sigma factor [Paraglaciecola sp.]
MSISLSLKTWFTRLSSDASWSNEALMLRYASSGDNHALSTLYDACGNDLYHFILSLSDPTLAKDISQATWLKVIEKKHLYKDSGSFKAWIFTLARNQLIDEIRRQKDTTADLGNVVAEQADEAHDAALLSRFNRALVNLPFAQREAFCLQQEDFSLEDIAVITHSNIEAVKSRLRYAKDGLRKQLHHIIEDEHV